MRTRPLKLALILLASVAIGRSQPAPAAAAGAPAPGAPEKSAAPAKGLNPAGGTLTRNKDVLSVDFPDEDIRTILRNVADLFDLNLVIPDSLQGKVSIKLHNVTWHQIYDVVLSPVGYTYIDDGGIIKVVSLASLSVEPVNTEIFTLNYARASDVQPSITSLIDPSKGGKLTLDARSNSLIVTERPSRLKKIRPIIDKLDQPTAQVMIETKFIEVTNEDVKNLGVSWNSMQSYKATLGNLQQSVAASSIPNAFYNLVNHPGSNAGVGGLTTSQTGVASPASITTLPSGAPASAVFSAQDFSVILSALQSLNTTKVVSNPTIVTLNNTEASINIGEDYPIPNYQYNQLTGSFEVSGFTYKPIGILLNVTPQVNANGFIKLTLNPEVSSTSNTVNFGGAGGATIPIINTRTAKTEVTLKDGYTMGIGGLISSNSIKNNSKVPLLGDIPLLGNLFKSKNKDELNTNLIIFVTAKTVSPEGASVGEVFDPRQTRSMGLQKTDLPGYRDGSNPFVTGRESKSRD